MKCTGNEIRMVKNDKNLCEIIDLFTLMMDESIPENLKK